MEWFKKWWRKPESKPEHGGETSPIESNPSSPSAAETGNSRPSVQVQTDLSREEQIEMMRDYIEREVAAGFADEDDIGRLVLEMMEDEGTLGLEGAIVAEQMIGEEMERHRREQLSWPAVTDCDRLDAAFRKLEENGIVARQNFTCCQTCGHAEIGGELSEFANSGKHARGYTFYHIQDTERAVEGGGVYLAFGTFEESTAPELSIANAVAGALREQGLEIVWDGTASQRILVKLDWKRRRAAREAGAP